jgi:hypothetical protein
MVKHLPIYALLIFVFCSVCNGQEKTEFRKDEIKSKDTGVISADSIERINKIDERNKRLKIKEYRPGGIDTETASQGLIIQNSLPKGAPHTDSRGKTFGVGILWSRVVNDTENALELTINFPVDSFATASLPDSYLKLFLLPDTMTLDKVSLYNYGVTSVRPILDTGLNKPTTLRRIIHPKEECIFYVAAVRYQVPPQASGTRRAGTHQGGGVLRTGLVLKEQDLFYRINVDRDSVVIPCGQLLAMPK